MEDVRRSNLTPKVCYHEHAEVALLARSFQGDRRRTRWWSLAPLPEPCCVDLEARNSEPVRSTSRFLPLHNFNKDVEAEISLCCMFHTLPYNIICWVTVERQA
jgi:hypothetical protein